MTNPWLHDGVERIIRDPRRKLGWSDRFFGTMRVALEQGIRPGRLGLGAAAALQCALEQEKGHESPREYLLSLWGDQASGPSRQACLEIVLESMEKLQSFRS